MMFIDIFVIIAVALSATGLVAAKKCHTGGIYCGKYLLQTGDYITKITTNLRASNITPADYNIQNSLWACIEHGDIGFLELCSVGCVGGNSKEDYCTAKRSSKKRDDEAMVELIN
ncbi:hypothetical protein F4782DRAFT_527335 [Xylaria castorea]|nr:hypothetical protein F4782DRAFT_527335 [Xylaria castorea]